MNYYAAWNVSLKKKSGYESGMAALAFNPCTLHAEEDRALRVLGQPRTLVSENVAVHVIVPVC